MKIIVFSDSHGNEAPMIRALRHHKDIDAVVFCGDGHRDIEDVQQKFPDKTFLIVRGNCDWCCDHALMQTITLAGKKLLITHGHAQMVKSGIDHLISVGHHEQADIVLYGHTHQQLTTADSRMLVCNPGSVGYMEEYAIIEIDETTGKITATEYPDNHYGPVIIT